jgi:hypothetical protein
MQFEICFLDKRGQLSCLLVSRFDDHRHASRFARHVMDTAACRDVLARAEVSADSQPVALIVHTSPGHPPSSVLDGTKVRQTVPSAPLRILRHKQAG